MRFFLICKYSNISDFVLLYFIIYIILYYMLIIIIYYTIHSLQINVYIKDESSNNLINWNIS